MRAIALLVALLALLVLAAGCGKDVVAPPVNRAPTTYLFTDVPAESLIGEAGDRHVVSYSQHLHWWGTDTDGRVVAYAWRIATLASDGSQLSVTDWAYTTRTDSVFAFPVDSTRVVRRFDVAAVDDDLVQDPVGKSQVFALQDSPPTVTFKKSLVPATSLPALTVFWSGRDTDGGNSILAYHLWMKGTDESQAMIVNAPDSSATLTPTMLAGATGPRTAYIRAVDTGNFAGATDSVTWNVTAITGNVLLFDEYPDTQPGAFIIDRFYTTTMDTAVTSTGYTLYKNESYGAFRSATEASELLAQFQYVVWYRDEYRGDLEQLRYSYSQSLPYAEAGLRGVLQRGGGVLLSGTYMFGTRGGLTPTGFGASLSDTVAAAIGFARDECGISAFRINDSLRTDFTVLASDGVNRNVILGDASTGTDSLGIAVNPGGSTPPSFVNVECLVPDPTELASGVTKVLWSIPVGQLASQDRTRSQPLPMPIGVFSTRSGGKAAYMGGPMALVNYYGTGWGQLRHVLALIGVPVLVP